MLSRRRVLVRLLVVLRHLEGEVVLEALPTIRLELGCLVNLATLRAVRLVGVVVGCLEISQPQLDSDLQLVSHSIIRLTCRHLYFSIMVQANASTTGTTAPVTTGTSSPAFSPFNEKDPSNSNVTLQYHSITAMEPYRGSSYEVR